MVTLKRLSCVLSAVNHFAFRTSLIQTLIEAIAWQNVLLECKTELERLITRVLSHNWVPRIGGAKYLNF